MLRKTSVDPVRVLLRIAEDEIPQPPILVSTECGDCDFQGLCEKTIQGLNPTLRNAKVTDVKIMIGLRTYRGMPTAKSLPQLWIAIEPITLRHEAKLQGEKATVRETITHIVVTREGISRVSDWD